RLRGIFAFVTLSNGTIVTIDVDDWDAPCRRPDPMAPTTQTEPLGDAGVGLFPLLLGPFNAIAPPQPAATSASDIDPYHAPLAFTSGTADSPVSLEAFFPVS